MKWPWWTEYPRQKIIRCIQEKITSALANIRYSVSFFKFRVWLYRKMGKVNDSHFPLSPNASLEREVLTFIFCFVSFQLPFHCFEDNPILSSKPIMEVPKNPQFIAERSSEVTKEQQQETETGRGSRGTTADLRTWAQCVSSPPAAE